jgi:hypothetical protein
MSFKVTGPVVQHLGYEGDTFRLKVVFPVYEIKDENLNRHDVEQERQEAGMRAIILRFRAEDLPMHATHGEILQCNIGRDIREQFGPFCKKCGSNLTKDALCSDETCPYSDRLQNATFTEE